jgi:hypothetical protein
MGATVLRNRLSSGHRCRGRSALLAAALFASPVATAHAGSDIVPAAVTDLAASPGDGHATLTWGAAAHATGYYVYMRNVTRGQSFARLPYPVQGSSWTANLLINGDSYQFQLQSINGLQTGGHSNAASVLPQGPTPAGVPDLSATSGNAKAYLSWTPATHATGYVVYMRDLTKNQSFTKLPDQVAGSSWTASVLVDGDEYAFRLQSMNGDQAGGTSNITGARPVGPVPGAVADLGATAGDVRATLNWSRVSNATSYYVWMHNVTQDDDWTRLPFPVPGPTWTVTELWPANTYQFRLQSAGGDQLGYLSNIVQVYIPSVGGTCASVAGDHVGTGDMPSGDFGARQYHDASSGICGYRSSTGQYIDIRESWGTNGRHLYDGIFRYSLRDCTTNTLAWYDTMQYPDNPADTAGGQGTYETVNPAHQYAVRTYGSGRLDENGLISTFGPAPPGSGIIPFDSGWSGCF